MVRAFLIGAGATKAQFPNAPLSSNFLKIIKETNPPIFAAINKVARQLILEDITKYSIEDLLFLAGSLKQTQEISLLTNVQMAIYDVLTKTTFSDEINIYPQGPETTFKCLLKDERLNPEDFFLTLNYDLYLDREIYAIQQSIDYGFPMEAIDSCNIKRNQEKEFSIFHLHGSVNWEISKNNGKVAIQNRAISPTLNRYSSNVCIIPPGIKKLNSIFQILWMEAEKRIEEADELILIGCSLNRDDRELLRLIHKFFDDESNVKIIHYADENQSSYHNYEEFFKTWEDYPFGFDIVHPKKRFGDGAIDFIFNDSEYNIPI